MKKLLIIVLLLFLTGCTVAPQSTQSEDSEPSVDIEHIDHHASMRSVARKFYIEKDQRESTEYYLSYREPDGCSTRVYKLHHGYLEPKLFCQNDSFYYINYREGYHTVVSEGMLEKVTFTGEHSSLQVDEELVLNYIIRVDEQYVYCAANEGKTFLRADLGLRGWEEVAEEDAFGE